MIGGQILLEVGHALDRVDCLVLDRIVVWIVVSDLVIVPLVHRDVWLQHTLALVHTDPSRFVSGWIVPGLKHRLSFWLLRHFVIAHDHFAWFQLVSVVVNKFMVGLLDSRLFLSFFILCVPLPFWTAQFEMTGLEVLRQPFWNPPGVFEIRPLAVVIRLAGGGLIHIITPECKVWLLQRRPVLSLGNNGRTYIFEWLAVVSLTGVVIVHVTSQHEVRAGVVDMFLFHFVTCAFD